jgi:PcfJ-like protein
MNRAKPSKAELFGELARLAVHYAKQPKTAIMCNSVAAQIANAPTAATERIIAAAWYLHASILHGSVPITQVAIEYKGGPLCPAFATARSRIQAQLTLGTRPEELLEGLTAKEASEALRSGYESADAFLKKKLDLIGIPSTSVPVLRWVRACLNDPPRRAALYRTARSHRDHIEGRYLDRVDEITPPDLTAGSTTGVQEAFTNARARITIEQERLAKTVDTGVVLCEPPHWWRPIRCGRLLNTQALLSREGAEMHHCVGTYGDRVARGESIIMSFRVRMTKTGEELRSTAEFSRTGCLVQHKGPSNAAPGPVLQKVVRICTRRWDVLTTHPHHAYIPFARPIGPAEPPLSLVRRMQNAEAQRPLQRCRTTPIAPLR